MSSSSVLESREREQSILDRLPQVRLLAQKLHRRCPANVLLEDLVSAGVTGLVEAADRFDGSRNIQFKTLAEHRIRGAMLDYLRSLDPLPRSVRRFVKDRDAVIAQWKQDTGADPSDDDIATKMGLEEGRFRQLSLIGCAADLLSLDSHNDPCTSDGNPETAAEWHQVNQAIRALPAPERVVILGFLEGRSLGEIGHSVGLSVGRVSQMKLQAIGRLRIALGARSRDPLRCDI